MKVFLFQGFSRKGPQRTPGPQRTAKGGPRAPQREPKGAKGNQQFANRQPNGFPECPKGAPGSPKGVQRRPQRRPIYTKTPDEPHQRPLCNIHTCGCMSSSHLTYIHRCASFRHHASLNRRIMESLKPAGVISDVLWVHLDLLFGVLGTSLAKRGGSAVGAKV